MAIKKTIEVDDVAGEGKAVGDIAKIFATLEDQDSIDRVALAVGVICGFSVNG